MQTITAIKNKFQKKINWNNYQSKATVQTQNQYSDYLIDPSFQGVDRPFLLLFENDTHHTSYMRYFFKL